MKTRFCIALPAVLLLMLWALVLPAASAGSAGTTLAGDSRAPLGTYAVVNNPSVEERLNLRENASRASGSLGRFDNGTTVEILEQGDTWCRVRIDEKTGYMLAKYLLMDSSATLLAESDVGRNDLSGPPYPVLRSAPSDNAAAVPLPDPDLGVSLSILSRAGTWYFVEVQGIKGFYPANRVMAGVRKSDIKNVAIVFGPVLKDRLNLRSSPSKTAAVLGKYFIGTQVKVLDGIVTGAADPENTWCQVEVKGIRGYMQALYLLPLQMGDPSTW